MVKAPVIKEGYIFIAIALLLAVLVGYFIDPLWTIFPIVLAAFFTFFFRNPQRQIPTDKNLIVSPADGKVMGIVEVDENDFVNERCNKVIIFLSVFDVHINRSPMNGEIKFQQYTCGRFIPAYKDSVGFENERHTIGIENGNMRIIVTQIAGILARRIVSWVTLGNVLEKGERYGLIKFGSCTELVMPKNVEICVKKGDKVVGGETVIGRIKA
ncbi:phosphatidylserine decarboxylase family protein [Anaerosinus gibii]|uniref:Phosphatidylserine decarboxylase proenzyme n=1 Tax=Selenobaculum gibii TaxID=3054208 RepID=A0A9Y2AL08_9FIRM|nr:phosphatidylserine decarboxylase family protein [Selenobaculum gbiensis]WIW71788.1 phosphatidylserine decarboxylase family protein [Selenobaculum gbiensis]